MNLIRLSARSLVVVAILLLPGPAAATPVSCLGTAATTDSEVALPPGCYVWLLALQDANDALNQVGWISLDDGNRIDPRNGELRIASSGVGSPELDAELARSLRPGSILNDGNGDSLAAVPEPASLLLLGVGLALARWRRRQSE